jgi:pilus assembly protein CpaC
LVGGEFPVPVAQNDGKVSIEFKPFGVGLGYTPVVLSEGRISLQLSVEVSELSTQGGYQSDSGVTVDPNTGQAIAAQT